MATGRTVRVLPTEAAIDKCFDYLAPEGGPDADLLDVGSEVRIELHGRRTGGWVVDLDVEPPPGVELRPLTKLRGLGPDAEVVDLARWAAWRWAGRWAHLLGAASPPTAVRGLGPPQLDAGRPLDLGAAGEAAAVAAAAMAGGARVVRLPPSTSPRVVVDAAAALGPTLVLVPTAAAAAHLAGRLVADGWPVALLPGGWAAARAGRRIVVGTRSAAFAPCPGLAAVVVVDAHDEAHASEAAPTWSAVEVAVERAARAGVPCALVSAVPTPTLVAGRSVVAPSRGAERERWAAVDVVDRRGDDPRHGLFSSRFALVAASAERIVCVLNRTGRARRLACRTCGEVACCSACGTAVGEAADGRPTLVCSLCAVERPRVCTPCRGLQLRALRVGVTRAAEELRALLQRPVVEVTAATDGWPHDAAVVLGTEAALGRATQADLVCFLDVDADLLAPRVTAADHVLALLATASRLVGPRRRPESGRVVVQTRHPDHAVLQAAVDGDPQRVCDEERALRDLLGLPPSRAAARTSGAGSTAYVDALRGHLALQAGRLDIELRGPAADGSTLVLAPDHAALADLLAAVERPAGRLRVEVDPARL